MNAELKTKILTEIKGAATDERLSGAWGVALPADAFADAAGLIAASGGRLVAEWATDRALFGDGFSVHAAFHRGTEYVVVTSTLRDGRLDFPTLSGHFFAAVRFERRIMSLFGLDARGLAERRPWIKHEDWPEGAFPLRKAFDARTVLERAQGRYDWIKAGGEGVYEIPVGPVHAGIIEPGHFRFLAAGEAILNLEERLGYVHKGIEKRFESLGWMDGARLAGRVSGDTTVAHALAYTCAIEAASGVAIPLRANYIRAVMLELERIANHVGDFGAINNDIAFTFMHYQMSILRERVLRACARVFGHRLMMDVVRPGGVAIDLRPDGHSIILDELAFVENEFERLIRIYDDSASVADRVWGAGTLSNENARMIGAVGFVGRASGQGLDVRRDNPVVPYDSISPSVKVLHSGDVHARAWVRVEEVREAIRLVREMLAAMPDGPIIVKGVKPAPASCGFSAIEGWRGEIVYWVEAGPDGAINRVMVRDPSCVNWAGLEIAARGNMVPDFPLCNKSFNQSYSGNDL